MSTLDGVFSLRTPRDLREKLEADYQRLASAAPTSREAQYAAFDFFVCAEHLAEWAAHATGQPARVFRTYTEGALVSHVANGAKHFSVDPKRHTEVSDTSVRGGGFQPGAFQSNAFGSVQQLVIELEDGSFKSVLAIADRILEHWRMQLP